MEGGMEEGGGNEARRGEERMGMGKEDGQRGIGGKGEFGRRMCV